MNDPVNRTRRKLFFGIMTLPAAGLAATSLPTPSGTEGPFYPTAGMRFDDIDNDLVKISGAIEQAGGDIVQLSGRVLDRSGKAVNAAQVEIWQCDVNGRYLHRGDFGQVPRDPAFQGFGRDLTRADGNYSFRTIKPVPYTGRTPHIHVKVLVAGRERLTTQFYLPDHPGNDRDWLYQRLPSDLREQVTMRFDTAPVPRAILDIVI